MRDVVTAVINYTAPMAETPRYHACDHSRDVHVLDPRMMEIENVRARAQSPGLKEDGFTLVKHTSRVSNFLDADELRRVYTPEIERLLCEVTGACAAVVVAAPFVRFAERSPLSGKFNNSIPARFVHIDYSEARARATAEQFFPQAHGRPARLGRFAHYNIWRVLSAPPQDVPLAVCSARTVADADLLPALAVFDFPGVPERTAESLVLRHNPSHRWNYFRDMTPDEALIFVTKESDPLRAHHVPHSAFDDPGCSAAAQPRSSIEIRAVAYYTD
ncbi:MAG TPA: CmcJ/NvfI family oxidoreductase [Steroidobacteraceae bacterium]|nr:CmcJ/NvfI family oxidoreductase [Steroidobacteraceae bacterium]